MLSDLQLALVGRTFTLKYKQANKSKFLSASVPHALAILQQKHLLSSDVSYVGYSERSSPLDADSLVASLLFASNIFASRRIASRRFAVRSRCARGLMCVLNAIMRNTTCKIK